MADVPDMNSSGTRRVGSLLVLQAGGPTAVINTTLAAVIETAKDSGQISTVCGVRRGLEGLIHNDMAILDTVSAGALAALRCQPGAALGSSRMPLTGSDIVSVRATLAAWDATALLMIGGNGTMLAAKQLDAALAAAGVGTKVIGVPKTADNDIPGTDRCPGYASAARFVAQSVRDVVEDVRTLPVPVSIFETMGRDTGWLVAASALARSADCPGPQIILLPEHPFVRESFLGRVDHAMKRDGWVVVAVSEGICNASGQPVFETGIKAHRDAVGRPVPGDVGPYLAGEVGRSLGLRCRSEKPGLCGRTSIDLVAPQDRADAEAVGRAAVEEAIRGPGGMMITLGPIDRSGQDLQTGVVALADLEEKRRGLPPDWINRHGEPNVDFIDYLAPRIGAPVRGYERL